MATRNLRRFFPFLAWFPLRAENVKADLVAGVTCALLAIPQSLAYAQLAGVPAHYGLYAALLPTIIGALFGSSGVLSTGPAAMTALLTAASVAQFAPAGSEQFYAYAVTLALLSGLFQIAFGVMRMGVLLNFMSYPVLMGFINAAAIIIGLSQLPMLLGMKLAQSNHFLADIWSTLAHLDTLHEMSLGLGVTAIVLLFAFKKFAPRWPGVLLTVAVMTLASYLLDYERLGGNVVGDIPQGLPGVSLPQSDWPAVRALLSGAFLIALISFMEAMSSCKIVAIKTRTAWDENQELIGQGLAKVAAAFSHAIPVSGSFSRTAVNLAAGARTGIASLISAAVVMATLLFFTPLLHHLPKPVLAAIIMVAITSLADYASIRKAWRAGRDDGIAAIITFVTTLAFAPSIQVGILTGILLSLALLLYRMMRPRVAVLGLHADGTLRDAQRLQLPVLHPELGAIRFDGSLIFVNVSYFEDAILRLENNVPGLKYILVASGGINAIDASGIEVLSNLVDRLKANGITLSFSGIKQQVLVVMEHTGLAHRIGAANIFPTDRIGLDALLQRLNAPRFGS
ncbi:MAG TPA: SulP family inorganic anion transporter [Burkholderiales bacterium]|nr:SulP family inorganic anion transporter [Burkholderiales bacterium]